MSRIASLNRIETPLDLLGFDSFSQRLAVTGIDEQIDAQITQSEQVFPDTGISGQKIESLNVSKLRAGSLNIDTYVQSTNYVAGVSGWKIDGAGNAEFSSITLTGGTIKYGKTSFIDSTNAGYYISSAGVYIGAASDATKFKYNVSTGLLDITGTLQSSDYSSGTVGWRITNNGTIEANDIFLRGEFHTQVLSYNSVHVTAGSSLLALSGGTLKSNVTVVGAVPGGHILNEDGTSILLEDGFFLLLEDDIASFNVDINDPPSGHVQVFSTGDILRIKDGSGNDAWMTIQSVSDQTTFFRYVCIKSSGSSATFYAGAAVSDYGQSGQGMIFSTVDSANSPYISVQTHAGEPWTTITERLRIGNLNGYLDYATNIYGFAVGSSSGTDANICIDPTNGIRIRQGTTSVLSFDNAGNANITGALIMGTSGNIHSGQTAYNTGVGFWLECNAAKPRFSIGNSAADFLTWNGTNLILSGALTGLFDGTVRGAFRTTATDNVNSIRIAAVAGLDGPTQSAHSLAVIRGAVNELEILPHNAINYVNWNINANPGSGAASGLICWTQTNALDYSADPTFAVIKLDASNAGGKENLIYLVNAGDGSSLKIAHAGTTNAPIVVSGGTQGPVGNVKFKRIISGAYRSFWESIDTTSPNGLLSGVAGDQCQCGDGNIYRCTGTTNWTAM